MRSERGFTLLELMGSLVLIGAVSLVAGGLAHHSQRTSELGAVYASDVSETRRALDRVECDLRSARSVTTRERTLVVVTGTGEVTWRLLGKELLRGDEFVARNVAAFTAERRDGGLVEVGLELGRRSPDARRTASVSTFVHLRAAEEDAK